MALAGRPPRTRSGQMELCNASTVSTTSSGPRHRRSEGSRSSVGTHPTVSSTTSDSGTTPSSPTEAQQTLTSPPSLAPDTEQYLLLCVKTGPNQIKLAHLDLRGVVDNAILYHRIRTEYQKLRSYLASNLFVTPSRVEYVNFELMQRRQTGECVGNYQTNSVPSIKEVMSGQYTFWPCPPVIGGIPIQSHIFMHSFLTPGDHGSTRDFERLPKKLKSKLV
ncbi:hypothetical protein PG996_010963 [Apiospora saccharicola]|uniref:Uncharacterized protein n=1 Tax=Apiospora saccharicola TaxID=335842 RepID=A0ABR1UDT4_9PEZI